jgi:hypothetical protein
LSPSALTTFFDIAKTSIFGEAPSLSTGVCLISRRTSSAPVAQMDRALDYESGGRGFKSLRVHHFPGPSRPGPFMADEAEVAEASGCDLEVSGFESRRSPQFLALRMKYTSHPAVARE